MQDSNYPKRYMTIAELEPFGFKKSELQKFIKIRGFPAYKAPGRTSKWKIDTAKLDIWLARKWGA